MPYFLVFFWSWSLSVRDIGRVVCLSTVKFASVCNFNLFGVNLQHLGQMVHLKPPLVILNTPAFWNPLKCTFTFATSQQIRTTTAKKTKTTTHWTRQETRHTSHLTLPSCVMAVVVVTGMAAHAASAHSCQIWHLSLTFPPSLIHSHVQGHSREAGQEGAKKTRRLTTLSRLNLPGYFLSGNHQRPAIHPTPPPPSSVFHLRS